MVLNTLKGVFVHNWPILVIFLVTIVTIRFYYLRTHREKICFYKEFLTIISIVYIIFLFQLLTQVELNTTGGLNLIPFTEILRYDFGSTLFIYNVLGNICIFIPFGLIIAVYINPKTIFSPLIIALIVSATVEFVQLNIGRSFDVDDILLNIAGSIIGYLIYIAFVAINNHLPKVFKSETLYNIICVVLVILIILYIVKITKVVVI